MHILVRSLCRLPKYTSSNLSNAFSADSLRFQSPYIASPNAPPRVDQGGIDTPPSPNCHLVHTPCPLYPQTPLSHFVHKKKTSPSLAADFRNNTIIHKCTSVSLEPLQGRRATPVPPHGPDAVGVHTLRRFKQWLGKRCSRLSLLWFPLEASNSSSSWILALHRTLQFHPNLQYHGI